MNSDFETKERELEGLRREIQSLSHRNLQLKDAVLRLTEKCEDWSDNYQKLTLESDSIKGVLSETTRQKLELEQSAKQLQEVNDSQCQNLRTSKSYHFL